MCTPLAAEPLAPSAGVTPLSDNRRLDRRLRRIERLLARLVVAVPIPPAADRPLSVAQAAGRAGVSVTTIRRAIRLPGGPDRLAAYDQSIGKRRPTWRIRPADLDAWCRRRAGAEPAPVPRTVRVPRGSGRQFKF